MWEPFIEPWSFCLKLIQHVNCGSPNSAGTTEIFLSSLHELNFNITESLVEVPIKFLCLLISILGIGQRSFWMVFDEINNSLKNCPEHDQMLKALISTKFV